MDINETHAALDAGQLLAKLQYVGPALNSGAPVMAVPAGSNIQILDREKVEKWLPTPMRKTGSFAFADVESFCRYFTEHKSEASRIFATVTDSGGSFRGVLNFHGKDPSFNDHACTLTLAPTKEWVIWTTKNREHMTQEAFAIFLEENAQMFTKPTGAALLELVATLEGHSNADISLGTKLSNGAIRLTYNEDVVLKGVSSSKEGAMDLPNILEVGIAPFQGEKPYLMRARLKYRIESRKVTFFYEAIDQHLVIRDVCQGIIDRIKETTAVNPFMS